MKAATWCKLCASLTYSTTRVCGHCTDIMCAGQMCKCCGDYTPRMDRICGYCRLKMEEEKANMPAAKPFDPNKPVQTQNEMPARILAQDAKGQGDYSLVGLVTMPLGDEIVGFWNKEGDSRWGDRSSLVNVPVRIHREVWVNVYPDNDHLALHNTKADADHFAFATGGRLACVKLIIDCEEGEGLEG